MSHAELMDGYYAIRQAEWEAEEAVTLEYPIETEHYRQVRPRTTFKMYLIGMRGR
jgi:hypothetical protein